MINGFKTCGLVPFDPDAVTYNILKKTNKLKSDQNLISLENPSSEILEKKKEFQTEADHLTTFEKNISKSLLEEFKNSELTGVWGGNVSDQGLFNYWLSIKKANYGMKII